MTKDDSLIQGWNTCKLLYHPCEQLEQQQPTVTREWVHQLIYDMIKPENYESVEFIVKKLNEIGVEVVD